MSHETSERLYKFLAPGGVGPYSGHRWPLPTLAGDGAWTPGAWVRVEGKLDPCRVGLHACREADTPPWIAAECYALEYRGERVDTDGKVVLRQARLTRRYTAWDERAMRLFAADCAERALPLYEAACPGDDRPRAAIETARAFARDEATEAELLAASAATRAAAGTAAGTAEAAAEAAAWAAAGTAARAAEAAARAAAWAAEAAAWAAAGAARAARAAAGAAWAAAGAAGADERAWQGARLVAYLEGGAA